jgi:predicted nucleic acid-binding protein
LNAVVRIVTNPRAFKTPSATAEAFGFCDNLLRQPHCQIVEPGERHWDIFRRLCSETDTRGARATDTWLAAPSSGAAYGSRSTATTRASPD